MRVEESVSYRGCITQNCLRVGFNLDPAGFVCLHSWFFNNKASCVQLQELLALTQNISVRTVFCLDL